MFILGIDIGYSNLKLAHGQATAPEPYIWTCPSGAAPVEDSVLSSGRSQRGHHVLVNGRIWVVGHSQHGLVTTSQRSLNNDYTETDAYRALFHLALLRTGADHVDRVVTGLPVSECLEHGRIQNLEEMLAGTHEVAEGMRISVGEVKVVPQPGGSLILASRRRELSQFIETGFVSVIDPGFFSTDWLTLDGGRIVESLSGTNMRAVSVVLQRAAELIRQSEGSRPPLEMLEDAVRNEKPTILVAGHHFDYRPLLATAAQEVGVASMSEITQNLRVETRRLDMVIVTGGGAAIYRQILETVLPKTRIEVLDNPVMANATGFWLAGH
ncbi:ParM/StbA family protein [Thioalkalivibrio sp. XN279]|uniref:ParM/StbA family protein n=1 Tax=Thioalkalivibrio sp. XN279 TaxID=2714953 RepID=UPI00140C6458|nr:ParM/StbA family protein [Thioalkalivibrio sp. XN279]NHA14629.1 ParM/StbA family protein [Thioalkalivibrio sp. XN279]